MERNVWPTKLSDSYCSVEKLASGVLAVPFVSTLPGVRAHGTHYFKPGSLEYNEIINQLGEMEVGDLVTFVKPFTPEEMKLMQRPLEERLAEIRESAKREQSEASGSVRESTSDY